MAQRRSGEHLCFALPVLRVRDAEVRHSGASPSWSLRGGTRVSSGLVARQMEELEESFAAGPALQLSLFQDTSDWLHFVLFCAEPQTSREVDQKREVGLTRQSNGRLCVRLYSSWLIFYHKTTVAGFFTEPLEPDTGKPCENSLKTHS